MMACMINFILRSGCFKGRLTGRCIVGAAVKTYSSKPPVIAIRREDKSLWERRAPLSPAQVQDIIVNEDASVVIQPSTRRAYSEAEYVKAGASVSECIDEADVILGVKEVPCEALIPNKKYVFFSHTIKGQEHNMEMLQKILSERVCLIDYERLVDDNGKRLVAFGKYAGIGGMINLLNGVGIRLLAKGYHTPFIYVAPAYNYSSILAAKEALKTVGHEIECGLLPTNLGPMIFTFTGSGNVSQGAQEIFQALPHEYVSPHELKDVKKTGDTRKVYGTVVHRKDYLVRRDGEPYREKDFLDDPINYKSTFAKEIAPYTTCLVNGVFWKPRNPRLLKTEDCKRENIDILAICDITADINGTLEFMKEYTTIEAPFLLYNPHTTETTRDVFTDKKGILMITIDNLPAQIPREATHYFGSRLKPFLRDFLKINLKESLENQLDISKEVKRAIIAYDGALTPDYEYLETITNF